MQGGSFYPGESLDEGKRPRAASANYDCNKSGSTPRPGGEMVEREAPAEVGTGYLNVEAFKDLLLPDQSHASYFELPPFRAVVVKNPQRLLREKAIQRASRK